MTAENTRKFWQTGNLWIERLLCNKAERNEIHTRHGDGSAKNTAARAQSHRH